MPFDDPQEQEDETLTQPLRLPPMYPDSGQTAPADDDQAISIPDGPSLYNQQLPASGAQFQRRFNAPLEVAPEPSIGQRILALGQRGPLSDTDMIGASSGPKNIGERLVEMGRQPTEPSVAPLSPMPGSSPSRSRFDQTSGPGEVFSDFIPLGSNRSGGPQAGPGRNYSPSLFASAELGQKSRKTGAGQSGSSASRASTTNVGSNDTQRQQNRDERGVTTSLDQDEDDLSPRAVAPTKVKPPQDVPSGDWSGGEAASGQPIVNSSYHTDYPGRGKRKIGGDPAWRNNNPGNIRYSTTSPATRNAIGSDYQNFAIFDTMQDGIRAQDTLWRTPRYQNMTLQQAVKSWTSSDPPATQESYLRDLMSQTGAGRDTKVSDLNETQFQRLQAAQRKREGGRKGRVVDIPKPKPTGKSK